MWEFCRILQISMVNRFMYSASLLFSGCFHFSVSIYCRNPQRLFHCLESWAAALIMERHSAVCEQLPASFQQLTVSVASQFVMTLLHEYHCFCIVSQNLMSFFDSQVCYLIFDCAVCYNSFDAEFCLVFEFASCLTLILCHMGWLIIS